MRKTKQFYFPLYPNEWLMGTVHMSNSQKGLYIDLLVMQSQDVEITYELILRRAEGILEDVDVVVKKFKKNKNGNYYNQKLKDIKEEIQRQREMNSKGGRNSQIIQKENKVKKERGTEVSSELSSELPLNNARLTLEHSDSLGNTIESIDPPALNSLDDLYKELYIEDDKTQTL